MANNTIGWGQGATNNSIGWGRGSTNNIGWGGVYAESWSGDTDIVGGDERFIITIDTTKAGSASDTFVLPWIGTYDVEWGDGTSDVGVSGTQTHTYLTAGTYDVAVTATTGRIFFQSTGDRQKLVDIKNWGVIEWTNFTQAFYGCPNLNVSATDVPDLSSVTSMTAMFATCSSLITLDVSNWDVSSVTSMSSVFNSCISLTTLDISSWDVSGVTDMSSMFYNCSSLVGLDPQDWDINQVTNFTNFATGVTISTVNYDALLVKWEANLQSLYPDGVGYTPTISINFGNSKRSNASAFAYTKLTTPKVDGGFGWSIVDGGGIDILDVYSGSAAGYSLRVLKSDAVYVAKIRRSSDNVEQDFTAAEITDGTLATFCAATDGYVVTWYDQSGSGNHLTQGTASAQPQIVSSGVVNLVNGMPTLDFDGTSHFLQTGVLSISQPYSFFDVVKGDVLGTVAFLRSTTTSDPSLIYVNTDSIRIAAGANLDSALGVRDTNQTLLSSLYNSTTSYIYKDGSSIKSGNAGTNALNDLRIGSPSFTSQRFDGKYQEIILYPSDQSANRTNIENNINDYYNIY